MAQQSLYLQSISTESYRWIKFTAENETLLDQTQSYIQKVNEYCLEHDCFSELYMMSTLTVNLDRFTENYLGDLVYLGVTPNGEYPFYRREKSLHNFFQYIRMYTSESVSMHQPHKQVALTDYIQILGTELQAIEVAFKSMSFTKRMKYRKSIALSKFMRHTYDSTFTTAC